MDINSKNKFSFNHSQSVRVYSNIKNPIIILSNFFFSFHCFKLNVTSFNLPSNPLTTTVYSIPFLPTAITGLSAIG